MADCVKCGGSMTEGFLIDHGDYGSQMVPKWHGGAPRKSFWMGIKEGDPQIDVRSYRCNRCGYLEHYAT